MAKRIFITGATGYVGKNLMKALLLKGHDVYALKGDIADQISLPGNIDVIYHCAGVIKKKEEMERVNVLGTENIIKAAQENNCVLIHLSSAGIIGSTNQAVLDENTACRPRNDYEMTKYRAEIAVKNAVKNGLRARILRPVVIFGPDKKTEGDSFFELLKSMRKGYYMNIGKGVCNMVHIDEVVKALLALGEADTPFGDTYILGNHLPYAEMDKIVKGASPAVLKKTMSFPYPVALAAASALSLAAMIFRKKNPLTFSRLRVLTDNRIYSQEKIEKGMHFQNSFPVEEYLKKTCEKYIADGALS